jgi:hypothetical protein
MPRMPSGNASFIHTLGGNFVDNAGRTLLPSWDFNMLRFPVTWEAAILHCEYPTPASCNPAELPAMIWSTNYGRLVSHTIFALFFGGSTFAPKCIIDGVNIQEYLQTHFANAFGKLAERVAAAGDLLDEVVIGWDSINSEPAEGLISWDDLDAYPEMQGSTLK